MATNSIAISKDVEATSFWQGAVVVWDDFSSHLILSWWPAPNHFSPSKPSPFRLRKACLWLRSRFRFPGVVAIAGGLSILLGYRAKLGAWLIVLFLIPVTLIVAQVLDCYRSHDGADSNDSVHEKCLHARRCPADFSLRSGAVQPGCASLALKRR